jgi:hypothetical protein
VKNKTALLFRLYKGLPLLRLRCLNLLHLLPALSGPLRNALLLRGQ